MGTKDQIVQDATALAQQVLEERLNRSRLPDLSGAVIVDAEQDFVGFALSIPFPGDEAQQIASRPAVVLGDATETNLQNAFDEGLRVIKEMRDEVSA